MRLIVTAGLLGVCLLGGGCAPTRDFDSRLNSIAKPYRFSILKWELRAIPDEVNQWVFSRSGKIDDEVHIVTKYFSLVQRIKILKSEIETANAANVQGDSASREAELNTLEEPATKNRSQLADLFSASRVSLSGIG